MITDEDHSEKWKGPYDSTWAHPVPGIGIFYPQYVIDDGWECERKGLLKFSSASVGLLLHRLLLLCNNGNSVTAQVVVVLLLRPPSSSCTGRSSGEMATINIIDTMHLLLTYISTYGHLSRRRPTDSRHPAHNRFLSSSVLCPGSALVCRCGCSASVDYDDVDGRPFAGLAPCHSLICGHMWIG